MAKGKFNSYLEMTRMDTSEKLYQELVKIISDKTVLRTVYSLAVEYGEAKHKEGYNEGYEHHKKWPQKK